jgi:DHA1 family bicyclomycin/chloramphenicol resistance-like MFS transporter
MFTFFTLLLNGLIAGAVAPFVTGSVVELAMASTALVAAGLGFWLWHLAVERAAGCPRRTTRT